MTESTATNQIEAPEPTPAESTDKPDREAARYRRQLREAEAARDALAARVETYQRAEAERLVQGPGLLLDASDLWRATELSAVLNEDGELDPEKVKGAVDQLVADKPHYAAPPEPTVDLDLGFRGMGSTSTGPTWSDVIAK